MYSKKVFNEQRYNTVRLRRRLWSAFWVLFVFGGLDVMAEEPTFTSFLMIVFSIYMVVRLVRMPISAPVAERMAAIIEQNYKTQVAELYAISGKSDKKARKALIFFLKKKIFTSASLIDTEITNLYMMEQEARAKAKEKFKNNNSTIASGSARSVDSTGSVQNVECKGCSAINTIMPGAPAVCDYCGRPLS